MKSCTGSNIPGSCGRRDPGLSRFPQGFDEKKGAPRGEELCTSYVDQGDNLHDETVSGKPVFGWASTGSNFGK